MIPSKVTIVEELPGSGTGDQIIWYSDGRSEYVKCGYRPLRDVPWETRNSQKVFIVEERAGALTGDRIVRYSDGVVEHVRCGNQPSRIPSSSWLTIPPVTKVPLPLFKNRAMRRAEKANKRPSRRKFYG